MTKQLEAKQLHECDINPSQAETLTAKINRYLVADDPAIAWQKISKEILTPQIPFKIHLFLFSLLYPNWRENPESAPAWIPNSEFIKKTNLAHFMAELKIENVKNFHAWTVNHFQEFWQSIIKKLHIKFQKNPEKIVDLSNGLESPRWLIGAKLNIIDSCFNAKPTATAVIYYDKNQNLKKITYAELNHLSNRVANSLIASGFSPGDAIAIDMPMAMEAVAIYLGIIKLGGIVVSIADSFSSDEIITRLRIAKTKATFTQDYILRGNKKLPLYEKIVTANAPVAIVLPCQEKIACNLRTQDIAWEKFLVANENFTSYASNPMDHCNILFSSGTTGEPKAVPWNHTTAIKAASDAYLHQNIQAGDILAWPTNLGWMMGPWLIFAALINQASIALYTDTPNTREFGKFVQDAKVTMLGVVPTLVAAWRQSHCMEGLDWQAIKVFSSTGECSNAEDMLYLMSLASYKPIIEYCGGTEIGGSYITSTLLENNYPSIFTTPAFGLDLVLLDESEQLSDNGEVALIPPSMGLSTELLNADHHKIYFADMPTLANGKKLRRHGDQAQRLANGAYSILGRADDTMNLGGIKISSAEIERSLAGIENVTETAAIAVSPPNNGPSRLVIYAVAQQDLNKETVKHAMQARINQHLNPLFKIFDLVFIKELPKTASNKIMRRVLRKQYHSK